MTKCRITNEEIVGRQDYYLQVIEVAEGCTDEDEDVVSGLGMSIMPVLLVPELVISLPAQ